MIAKIRRRRLLLLAMLCALLTACELDETLTIKPDGSGTYVARFSVEKQFAGAMEQMKTSATEKGYRVIEESETADRKVLVISRDFRDVSELSDNTDKYALRIDRTDAIKTLYALSVTRSSANGFEKRVMHIVLPVKVKSASAGTIDGSKVEWDDRSGGTLEVEGVGLALPFGLTPAMLGLIIVAIIAVIALVVLRRRGGARAMHGVRRAERPQRAILRQLRDAGHKRLKRLRNIRHYRFMEAPGQPAHGRPTMNRKLVSLTAILLLMAGPLFPASDLYVKDTAADTGIEPNPDSGPMYVSDDIWVRINPDPGYQPYPFSESSPLPWTPLAHENPEYRDPKFSVPNWVYVRIHNRGNTASTGTERLRINWAKASTGLSWPTQWGAALDINGGILDYMASTCGPTRQFGAEMTKPRRNAATATPAERDAYRNAVLAIGTTPALVFPDNDYWHKQNQVHANGPTNRHGTPAFLPWHREFVNRYEVLLQEFDPTVKLLYWDWTQNPETGSFNFDTPAFMGASGSGAGGANAGAPFNPSIGPTLAPPTLVRDLGGNALVPNPTSTTDASLVGTGTFPPFRTTIENTPHNNSHVYIGGSLGQMRNIPTAAQDPFFFLLHGDVDRLWAQWQRGATSRLDPAATFGLESSNANMVFPQTMGPWDGVHASPIRPWTTGDGYIVVKLPSDVSVVSPPIYDVAPLTIPVLQPGEAVVMQVPWYPPNPANFSCFNGDQGHFCLLARIETSTSAPFGMTFPETTNVGSNARNNNNIAWKNIQVVDNFSPLLLHLTTIIVRNPFTKRIRATLRFDDAKQEGTTFFGKGRLTVDLGPRLFQKWRDGGGEGRGVKVVDEKTGRLEIGGPGATIGNLVLDPEEAFPVTAGFQLPKDYPLRRIARPMVDMVQLGTPDNPETLVGGQRFTVDFSKIVLVKRGDTWRYWDFATPPNGNWTAVDFDEARWKSGKGDLGFGGTPATTIDGGPRGKRRITTYFRHRFDIADPTLARTVTLWLERNDGAVVYLNGKEIHRVNMPAGKTGATTAATRNVTGVEAETYFAVKLDPSLLRAGANVLAVEVHQSSPRNEELTFDAELSANNVPGGAPATVAIAAPPNGALVQVEDTTPIRVEAIDGNGTLKSIEVFVDGRSIGRAEKSPQVLQWKATGPGLHHVRAVATDNDGERSEAFTNFSVVENTPPAARLTTPTEGNEFKVGEPIPLAAEASDRGGAVERVEFWVREADFFLSEARRVAVATKAPFTATVKDLPAGHFMVWAVAVDNRELESQSVPVHIMVH